MSDYLDEYLTEADRRRFDEHLAGCCGCLTIVEQFRATIAATASGDAERVVPPATRDHLLAELRACTKAPSAP